MSGLRKCENSKLFSGNIQNIQNIQNYPMGIFKIFKIIRWK